MNWYRKVKFAAAETQGDLFEEPQEEPQEEQGEPIERENPDISFVRGINDLGAHFVVFRIGDKYYSYKLSFPDWVGKVRYWARFSPGKALNWTKEKATQVFEVTEDYPGYGSIIREIKGE